MRSWFGILLGVLLLAGCTLPQPRPDDAASRAWAERRQQLEALDHWVLNGRMALHEGDRHWQANVHWRQAGEAFDMQIYAAFGRPVGRLQGDEQGVSFTTREGETYFARDADELLHRVVGWHLPVQGLRHWVLGLPSPGRPVEVQNLDAAGRLHTLVQDGWTVRYRRHDETRQPALPDRLELEFEDIRVRLLVDSWQELS